MTIEAPMLHHLAGLTICFALVGVAGIQRSAAAEAGTSFLMAQRQTGGEGGRDGASGENRDGRKGGGAPDCSDAGSKAAGQTGGRVLSVSAAGGGCRVTVLVPGSDGARPRKTTVTIRP